MLSRPGAPTLTRLNAISAQIVDGLMHPAGPLADILLCRTNLIAIGGKADVVTNHMAPGSIDTRPRSAAPR